MKAMAKRRDGKAQVLFVDDETDVLDGLRRALATKQLTWGATFVADPGHALSLSRRQRFDLVVADIRMPGLDGITMVESMRREDPCLRSIVLSGTSDFNVAVDVVNRTGASRFLRKPCPVDNLVAAIDAALLPAEISSPVHAVFARLPIGVLIVDREARLLYMNRRGAALLEAAEFLCLGVNNVVTTGHPAHASALHRAIATVAAERRDDVIALPGAHLTATLSLGLADCGEGVAIHAQDSLGIALPAHLAKLLGLTPSEAGLAHALALTGTLEDAAQLRGLTPASARTYLKLIFAKTGARRQTDLVRLVMEQPRLPVMSVGSSATGSPPQTGVSQHRTPMK